MQEPMNTEILIIRCRKIEAGIGEILLYIKKTKVVGVKYEVPFW